jgi:PAS domain-containing protein
LNNQGKPYRYVAIRADITTRKNAEENVIKAYKEKEAVLNRISDGVVSVDNDWIYTFINDAALDTHTLGRADTLGRSDIHPEMKGTLFWDKYHEAMMTKKVVEIETFYAPMNVWLLKYIHRQNSISVSRAGIMSVFLDQGDRGIKQRYRGKLIRLLPVCLYPDLFCSV